MALKGETILILLMIVLAIGVILSSIHWPLKASLFPLVVSLMITLVAIIELSFSLFGKERKDEITIDFKLSENVDKILEKKRTFLIFSWIIIFFFLIKLFGFHIAIPIFFILFWRLNGKEGWKISIVLAAISWLCFYGLFIWLLNIPFMEG